MKYIKYTSVDSLTQVPINEEPARNGPASPAVDGLEYAFGLESQWPTSVPIYYGKVPDTSSTKVPGVLEVVSLKDFNAAKKKELQDRFDSEKYNKLSQVESLFQRTTKQIKSTYSEAESATWARQEKEAKEYLADNLAVVPFLKSLLVEGEDLTVFSSKVVEKAQQYYMSLGVAIQKKRSLEKQISVVTDSEALSEIVVQ